MLHILHYYVITDQLLSITELQQLRQCNKYQWI